MRRWRVCNWLSSIDLHLGCPRIESFVRPLLTSWPSRPLMRRSTAYAGDPTSMWTTLIRYFHNDSVRQLFYYARISYEEWTKEFVKTIPSHESCFDWPLCCGKHESGAIQGSPSMKQWLIRVTYVAKNSILGCCVTSLRHPKCKDTSYEKRGTRRIINVSLLPFGILDSYKIFGFRIFFDLLQSFAPHWSWLTLRRLIRHWEILASLQVWSWWKELRWNLSHHWMILRWLLRLECFIISSTRPI